MTVVLCGSLGSTALMWEPQLPVLRDPVVVEHPGHGGAPLTDVPDVAALARRVLDAVPGPFSFVGLSLGGAVGIRLAADAPDRLQRLVLACTSPRFGEPAQWHERAALVRRDGLGAIVDAVMGRWFTPGFGDAGRYRDMFLSVEAEGYASCCEALSSWDARDVLGAIRAPTLVVAGSEDPTSPPAHAEELVAGIPGARLAVLERAAHLANVERPAAFNTLLAEEL